MMKMLDNMEQRMEEQARQVHKDQTDAVVASVTNNIDKRLKQVVSQELNRTLPVIINRSLGSLEKELVAKVVGVETRVAKELATPQFREAIGKAVASNMTEVIEKSYKQAFAEQAAGFERALGSLLQQISEQFLAGSKEYEAALGRRMEVENVNVREMVAPVVSITQEVAGEFRKLNDVV